MQQAVRLSSRTATSIYRPLSIQRQTPTRTHMQLIGRPHILEGGAFLDLTPVHFLPLSLSLGFLSPPLAPTGDFLAPLPPPRAFLDHGGGR